MKAIGYRQSLAITEPEALIDFETDKPKPAGRDLLVAVRAVSVNPVDTKVRRRAAPADTEPPKILGYDAAGVVEAVGPDVTLFKAGDEVFYAGSIARQGTNSEIHLVDERIVGKKPKSLSFPQAAALPLTAITAWEMLFDRLGVKQHDAGDKRAILIIGGAGGVGSILIQLARKLTNLTVIATASRQESADWCKKLGAHHVIDHGKPMPEQAKALGFATIPLIVSLTHTDKHYAAIAEMIAPQGKFGLIDDPPSLDAMALKRKCASIHWEFMFARPVFDTADVLEQHKLLEAVSAMVDKGDIVTTLADEITPINAANLKKAHALIESGKAVGKVVLSGW
jgi:NADPH2:quinone reductase